MKYRISEKSLRLVPCRVQSPPAVLVTLAILLALATSAFAATHYVNVNNPAPVAPYTDWTTAATNIQDAVDVSVGGEQIMVADGVYRYGGRAVSGVMTNRVALDRAVTILSVNGPTSTTIVGSQVTGATNGSTAIRCVYLTNGAALVGFTLSGGATHTSGDSSQRSGGGVYCEPSAVGLSNCVLIGCAASQYGGGAYGGTLLNCALSNNWASSGGGAYQAILTNCTLIHNSGSSSGGGTFNGRLFNCLLALNSAPSGGGACYSNLWNCTLTNNSATSGGGAYNANLTNCTLVANSATTSGGGTYFGVLTGCAVVGNASSSAGGGSYYGTLINCTVTGNRAVSGGGAYYGTYDNCIVYYNTAFGGPNYVGTTLNYCCATPSTGAGSGSFDLEPQLASASHLSAGSPCRGAGSLAYAIGFDIDGEPWGSPPSMGCDEPNPAAATGPMSAAIQLSYTNVAVGFMVDLLGTIWGDVTASRWEFDDGIIISNRPYASRSWANSGDYIIVLRAFNTANPGGISATASVHVVSAPVHYVAAGNPSPVPPYSSWTTAATNIQDGVDAATVPGAMVLVTNGLYQSGGHAVYLSMTNRVAVTKPLVVQSVNGPDFTSIVGASAVRCVYLTNRAELMGFTLTNGGATAAGDSVQAQSGGGVWCASQACVVSNCVILGNQATFSGGGAYQGMLSVCILSNNAAAHGGGVESGLLDSCKVLGNRATSPGGGVENGNLTNCILSGNSSGNPGGGASQSTLIGCILSSNSASIGGGSSGGMLSGCTLNGNSAGVQGGGSAYGVLDHCVLIANTSSSGGGGGSYGSTLNYCTVSSNYCSYGGGMAYATANNCTIIGNSAYSGGGAYISTLNSCAVAGNSASSSGGGIASGTINNCTLTGNFGGQGGGASDTAANNSILFYNTANTANDGPNYWFPNLTDAMNYCCTTPISPVGVGSFDTEPQLASFSHISAGSPCRGAGSTSYVVGVDIDGEPWASPPSVGCDEPYATAIPGPLSVSFQASCTNFGTNYSVDFVANISGDASASRWEFGDGIIVSNLPYASHAWAAGGDYLVILRAYNSDNPTGVTASLPVHVVSQPIYVSLDSSGAVPPYNSWATAATNINDAVDAAVPGGQVLVSNGLYAVGGRIVSGSMSNRVAVTKPIIISSINGPAVTVIQGFQVPAMINADGAVRCVYLTNGASLLGFTLTNGATRAYGAGDMTREQSGGGVLCELGAFVANCWLLNNSSSSGGGGSYSGTLSNCVLAGNSSLSGGGAYGGNFYTCNLLTNTATYGGGVNSGTLISCAVNGNSAASQGGGAYSCFLTNCVLMSNSVSGYGPGGGANGSYLGSCVLGDNSASTGGGAYQGSLSRCTITNNSAILGAGAFGAELDGCWLINNSATDSGGGANSCTLNNCVLLSNSATNDGGGAYYGTLNNCTLVGNAAASGGGAFSGALNNTIAYYNLAQSGANYPLDGSGYTPTINYCSTTPATTNGVGNITNEPLFVLLSSDLHLQSNSPCINSGNNAYVTATIDLDGNRRIVRGTVDIGAYEYQGAGSRISYAWLEYYGLPTDGSADFVDSDNDGMNNWQEWVCGTNPTNAQSALRIVSATPTVTNVTVTWQSVAGINYFVQRSATLKSPFVVLVTNIVGQAGTTSYSDTSNAGAGPFFYRVGVNSP